MIIIQGKHTHEKLKDLIATYVGPERVPKRLNVITDTSDFFRVDYDDVVVLDGRPYLIRNYEREGRFGIDDEPKFWVKRAIDLDSGNRKIIKMVFIEKFKAKVGDITFDCIRSPKKEARILDIVRDHPNFMQGFSTSDSSGNTVRIIEYIRGRTMVDHISGLGKSHEDYFHNHFPSVFNDYIELVKAIGFLHERGEKHGDIRRDHILKDKQTGLYRWIDFDFDYWHKENMFGYDLFGLGNILLYITGRGDVTAQYLKKNNEPALDRLTADDMNIFFNNRVASLKKIYPYIPDALNIILMHFSVGADTFYDDVSQLLNDLQEVRENLFCS